MATATDKNKDVATLTSISITVERQNRKKPIDMRIEAIEQIMKNYEVFLLANTQKSLDGTKVINYANGNARRHSKNVK